VADRFLSRRRKRHLEKWSVHETAREVLFARTGDDWTIALSRYGSRAERRYPVVLCHGLAANRHVWDLEASRSLARHLADTGFDVFALELRGHGRSEKPPYGKKTYDWSFFDYVQRDAPAAIDAVVRTTGASKVHWVGHSMGGILLLARLALGEARIASGTTIGSSLDYSNTGSAFEGLIKLLPLTRVLNPVPLGPFAAAMAPSALAFDNPIDRFNVYPANIDRELYRKLTAVGFHPVPRGVLRDLAGGFRSGGLRLPDGSMCVKQLPSSVPVLSMAGTEDRQCSPTAARRHGTAHAVFGKVHGTREEYGHFDLIVGDRARTEVWPTLVDWLEAQDEGR